MERAAIACIAALALCSGCGDSGACTEGFVEVGGQCVCGLQCGAHEECVLSDGGPECACTTGYAGTPCEWTGTPESPGFSDPDAWPGRTNGAAIEPLSEVGPTGIGIASFRESVVCNAGAVSQVVEMPDYDLADPFVVVMTYRTTGIDILGSGAGGVAVGYNRAFAHAPSTNGAWWEARFCLGEAAYNGEVKFQVAAAERNAGCSPGDGATIEVDRFEVLVADAGECPAPGFVLNGDANVDGGGWFFGEPLFSPGFAEGRLQDGVGEGGSSGAVLYKEAGSGKRVTLGTRLSVPEASALPSPTLSFWWSAPADQQFLAEIGNFTRAGLAVANQLDQLIADGEPHRYTYCLPPWTQGNTIDLFFRQLVPNGFDRFFEEESTFVVDSVELGSDDACGTSTDLLDPSFDSSPFRWPHSGPGWPGNTVRAIDAPELARNGDGVLAMRYGTANSMITGFGARIWIPPSDGSEGPQLIFHSNVPADPGARVSWVLGLAGFATDELLPGGGWRRTEVCLPPEWSERWFRFGVQVGDFFDEVVEFDAQRQVLLDDFEVRTDPACRASN
ncbi:MAG: hypothetical protein OEN21_12765 [Myxococcales bacterium]|nr:hypothetical protein [Myxococcales bacterium]